MMDSSMYGKIDKAKRYAEERERIKFHSFEALIEGNNSDKTVRYNDGKWDCDCHYFSNYGVCAHTMAFEILLEKWLSRANIPSFSLVIYNYVKKHLWGFMTMLLAN